MKWKVAFALMAVAAMLFVFAACQDEGGGEVVETGRLETVKERGKVICASRNDVPGYGFLDSAGNNVGFDIDPRRAVG